VLARAIGCNDATARDRLQPVRLTGGCRGAPTAHEGWASQRRTPARTPARPPAQGHFPKHIQMLGSTKGTEFSHVVLAEQLTALEHEVAPPRRRPRPAPPRAYLSYGTAAPRRTYL
jgi:hypothetical protein